MALGVIPVEIVIAFAKGNNEKKWLGLQIFLPVSYSKALKQNGLSL